MSGCGHRTVHQSDLCRMDVVFRKLLRMVVGVPGNLDWSRPWHEILHEWNCKVNIKWDYGHIVVQNHIGTSWRVGQKSPALETCRCTCCRTSSTWLDIKILIADQVSADGWLAHSGIQHGTVDTLDGRFRYFCFRPGPMKNNEHFVGNFPQFFPSSCAQYGLPTGMPDELELVRFRNQWDFLIYLLHTVAKKWISKRTLWINVNKTLIIKTRLFDFKINYIPLYNAI